MLYLYLKTLCLLSEINTPTLSLLTSLLLSFLLPCCLFDSEKSENGMNITPNLNISLAKFATA